MTMVVDSQHRQFGGNLGYDHLYTNSPHFTDPWSAHSSTSTSNSLYPSALASSMTLGGLSKHDVNRPTTISMPYSSLPVSAPSLVTNNYQSAGYGGSDLLSLSQELPRTSYGTETSYATTSAPTNSYAPSPNYTSMNYAQTLQQQQQHQHQQQQHNTQQEMPRKLSNPSVTISSYLGPSTEAQHRRSISLVDFDDRSSDNSRTTHPNFGDALDAGRGMVAMSQDLTPRNIYAPKSSRGSGDAYGFPATHSSHSSISSQSNYPYYGSSVAGSVAGSADSATDYSSAASDYETMPSRTLPRPNGLMSANLPPAPQSMMGQFSSKVPSNTQKKHKCKICDKRFTRPSSLQTHIYSHTGEKPYACEVDGCGRHFSVVSNLRRHRKVHRGERPEDHSSPDE